MSIRCALILFLLVLTTGNVLAENSAPHPFSVNDMLAMDRLSDPQVSPDGKWVAFNVSTPEVEANRSRTNLWLASLDGKVTRQLTDNPASDSTPRWADDNSIYFLSSRSGKSQIWQINPNGGEARQFSDFALGVANLKLAPSLGGMLFTMDVYPGMTVAETVARDAEKAANKTTGMIYDELMFRHWDTWEDGKRSHIFLLKMGSDEPVDLMPEVDTDVPTRPWGGMEEVAISPDATEVIFTAKMLPGSEPAWSTDYDLYAVAADGSGEMRCLTEANEAWDTEPVFTPDGKTLCYLAMDRPGFEADRYHLELMNWATGKSRRLDVTYGAFSLSPHGLKFSGNGNTIYASVGLLGQKSILKIDVKSGAVNKVQTMGSNSSINLLSNRLLFLHQNLNAPNELYTIKPNGSDLQQLTHFNDAKLAQTLMGEPEQFTFPGWNDETVHTYVVKPYDWTAEKAAAGQTWPVAFLIHGGPQGSFGNSFHYRWNPQAYVGAGFTTVAVDFHGSTGYGQEFTDSISNHWGDRPLEDLEKGLAAALKKYTWMDDQRVVAAGASYGGYMINWMHGQPFASKFKAFVNHDGNLDELMAYYDTEELWFPEWEHGGAPWSDGSGYGKHNPTDFVQNWHVPTLVVHGALDYRVVDTQGLSTFTALRRQGIPARLLYFPDENHWVLKPQNSIQWHDEVMSWLTHWTK